MEISGQVHTPVAVHPGTFCVDDWVRLRDELDSTDYKNKILALLESKHDS
jgi:hypothetical protein